MPFTEKDVTADERYMAELKRLVGRFATPALVIDGEVLLGFGMNLPRVRELLVAGGYLKERDQQSDQEADRTISSGGEDA
ncbi:MAG TPA: glutaredoxin family protein [Caldilineae bacterium]|nr:glutaredoxin family protein [Caldilineae bacterium]